MRALPLALFLAGTLLVAMVRGGALQTMGEIHDGTLAISELCAICQRNTTWLYWLVRGTLTALSDLFFLGPDAGAFARDTPWEFAPVLANRDAAIQLLSLYGTRLLLAIPAFVLVCRILLDWRWRLVYVAALLALWGGWPATGVNLVLSSGSLVADWPPAYYNFAHPLFDFDWAGIGFVSILALVLLRNRPVHPLLAAVLAGFGQAMMDNLGMASGVTLACAAAYRGEGWRRAALLLASSGLGAALVLGAIGGLGGLGMERAGLLATTASDGFFAKVAAYFGYWWDTIGVYNFLWFNTTVANFLSLLALPLAVGCALGALLPRAAFKAIEGWHPVAMLGCCAVGIFVTLVLGLFKSGYGSDMGRQVMPLLTMIMPLAMLAVQQTRFHFRAPAPVRKDLRP